jgi:hypothetical protein
MSLAQILFGCVGKPLLQQRHDLILPEKVDDFFVRQHRVGRAQLVGAEKQKQQQRRPQRACRHQSSSELG